MLRSATTPELLHGRRRTAAPGPTGAPSGAQAAGSGAGGAFSLGGGVPADGAAAASAFAASGGNDDASAAVNGQDPAMRLRRAQTWQPDGRSSTPSDARSSRQSLRRTKRLNKLEFEASRVGWDPHNGMYTSEEMRRARQAARDDEAAQAAAAAAEREARKNRVPVTTSGLFEPPSAAATRTLLACNPELVERPWEAWTGGTGWREQWDAQQQRRKELGQLRNPKMVDTMWMVDGTDPREGTSKQRLIDAVPRVDSTSRTKPRLKASVTPRIAYGPAHAPDAPPLSRYQQWRIAMGYDDDPRELPKDADYAKRWPRQWETLPPPPYAARRTWQPTAAQRAADERREQYRRWKWNNSVTPSSEAALPVRAQHQLWWKPELYMLQHERGISTQESISGDAMAFKMRSLPPGADFVKAMPELKRLPVAQSKNLADALMGVRKRTHEKRLASPVDWSAPRDTQYPTSPAGYEVPRRRDGSPPITIGRLRRWLTPPVTAAQDVPPNLSASKRPLGNYEVPVEVHETVEMPRSVCVEKATSPRGNGLLGPRSRGRRPSASLRRTLASTATARGSRSLEARQRALATPRRAAGTGTDSATQSEVWSVRTDDDPQSPTPAAGEAGAAGAARGAPQSRAARQAAAAAAALRGEPSAPAPRVESLGRAARTKRQQAAEEARREEKKRSWAAKYAAERAARAKVAADMALADSFLAY